MNALPIHPASSRGRSRMRLFLGACAAALAAATAMVAAPGIAHAATCSNQTGTNSGYYYQMWTDGQGSACITLNSAQQLLHALERHRRLRRRRRLEPRQQPDGQLQRQPERSAAAPRWSRSTAGRPTRWSSTTSSRTTRAAAATAGHLHGHRSTSDGGTYNIYEHQQVNQPSIQGTS